MATIMPTYHNGDGDNDPSRPPTGRIPSGCQNSALPPRPKKLGVRGKGKDAALYNEWKANGKCPLPIEFNMWDNTVCTMDPRASKFTTALGNVIGEYCSPCYKGWRQVPDSYKENVIK